jgi:hypothetical protein
MTEPFIPLSKTQKNALFQILKESGLQPNDFQWIDEADEFFYSLKLVYMDSAYSFAFTTQMGSPNFDVKHIPAHGSFRSDAANIFWSEFLRTFSNWAEALKIELDQPDLWDVSRSESILVERSENDDGSFLPEEIQMVESRLEEIAEYIKSTAKTSDEQQRSIEDKLNYLVGAAQRQSKRDWKNLAFSVLVQIILTLSLSQESGNDLLRFAGNALKDILAGGIKALP